MTAPTIIGPDGRKTLPVFALSNSEIQTFKRCRRKWYLAHYRKLRRKQQFSTGALAIGNRIHASLEAYYTDGQDPVKVHSELLDKDRQALLYEGRDITELESEGDLGRIMLEGYLQWLEETGADADWRVISAEQQMSVPLFNGEVELLAKLDMRVQRITDNVRLLVDHKAQPIDQPILTPAGWRPIGTLKIGDYVTAPDGSSTAVTGIYPQGEVPIYKIQFSDKSSTRACADHLWQVTTQWGKKELLTTQQLSDGIRSRPNDHRWNIPLVAQMKIEFEPQDLPVDPYILGVLLGDGCRRKVEFSSVDQGIVDEVRRCLPEDHILHHDGSIGYSIQAPRGRNQVALYLRESGLYSCYSYEKFVPTAYLLSSAADRLAILQGLLDTDGHVRKHGKQVVFGSTSKQLRDDVVYLVRSLGGYATPNDHGKSSYKKCNGETVVCREVYGASLRLTNDIVPFRLRRKIERYASVARRLEKRKIINVIPDGVAEAVCIQVAHLDHLYVTNDFIVTHNTVANFADWTRKAYMDEQLLTYHIVEMCQVNEPERCDGAVYNMLRKVKRSASARPPFYERLEVRHNKMFLNSFWKRLHGEILEIRRLAAQLDAGADHMQVAYPTPTNNCHWDCDFYPVCPLIDDGSAAEQMLDDLYEPGDPYERYRKETVA